MDLSIYEDYKRRGKTISIYGLTLGMSWISLRLNSGDYPLH